MYVNQGTVNLVQMASSFCLKTGYIAPKRMKMLYESHCRQYFAY